MKASHSPAKVRLAIARNAAVTTRKATAPRNTRSLLSRRSSYGSEHEQERDGLSVSYQTVMDWPILRDAAWPSGPSANHTPSRTWPRATYRYLTWSWSDGYVASTVPTVRVYPPDGTGLLPGTSSETIHEEAPKRDEVG